RVKSCSYCFSRLIFLTPFFCLNLLPSVFCAASGKQIAPMTEIRKPTYQSICCHSAFLQISSFVIVDWSVAFLFVIRHSSFVISYLCPSVVASSSYPCNPRSVVSRGGGVDTVASRT